MTLARAILFALCLCLLTGCLSLPDYETSQEYTSDAIGFASDEQIIGQSLRAGRGRINGMYLWLAVEGPQVDGRLTITLSPGPGSSTLLWTKTIPIAQIPPGGPLRFNFPPQTTDSGQFFISLYTHGGRVKVMGRSEDAYPGGQAYLNSSPLNADLAFRVFYDYDAAALAGDLATALAWGWLALPLALILILPGWLLLDCLNLRQRYDGGEQIALSVGLSLAILPILLIWSSSLGLHWNRAGALAAAGVLSAGCAWRLLRRPPASRASTRGGGVIFVELLGVFALSLAIRLIAARDLSAPPWVDSIHHAALARLILENGAIPDTYAPLIEIDAQQYHAGFHSTLAFFQWLSALDLPQGMLFFGQALNALIVFAAYLFGITLTHSRRAGLGAALTASLLSPQPAYYTSWGRYTLLTGLLILPALLCLASAAARQARALPTRLAMGVAAAGLFLVHYQAAAFAAGLLLAWLLSRLRWRCSSNLRLLRQTAAAWLSAGAVALGLALPWAWPAVVQIFTPILRQGSSGAPLAWFAGFSWRYLTMGPGQVSLTLAWIGLGGGLLWRGRRWAASLVLWVLYLLLLGNLAALRLPGGWVFNNLEVEITFFFPIACASGWLLSHGYTAAEWLIRRARGGPQAQILLQAAFALALLGLGLWGAGQMPSILNPNTVLLRAADRAAMRWVAENIPAGETVLINPFLWGYNTYAGADGGFWLTSLALRPTMPPPVIAGLNRPGANAEVRRICQQVLANSKNAENLWQLMQAEDLHTIYLGARGGALSARALQDSPRFTLRYAQEGVWIFTTNSKSAVDNLVYLK